MKQAKNFLTSKQAWLFSVLKVAVYSCCLHTQVILLYDLPYSRENKKCKWFQSWRVSYYFFSSKLIVRIEWQNNPSPLQARAVVVADVVDVPVVRPVPLRPDASVSWFKRVLAHGSPVQSSSLIFLELKVGWIGKISKYFF